MLVKLLLAGLSGLIVSICPSHFAGAIIFTIFTLINSTFYIFKAWDNSQNISILGAIVATCLILYLTGWMIFGTFSASEYY